MRKYTENTITELISKINALMSKKEEFEAYEYFLSNKIEITPIESRLRKEAYQYAKTLPTIGTQLKMLKANPEFNYTELLDIILEFPELQIYRDAFKYKDKAWNFQYDLKWIAQAVDYQRSIEELYSTKGECLKRLVLSKTEVKELQELFKAFKKKKKHSPASKLVYNPIVVACSAYQASNGDFDWFANKHFESFSANE